MKVVTLQDVVKVEGLRRSGRSVLHKIEKLSKDLLQIGCCFDAYSAVPPTTAVASLYAFFNSHIEAWSYRTGFCKQQLWPLFHYLLPLSPLSTGRFDPELWQAYVKANKVCSLLQEFLSRCRLSIQLTVFCSSLQWSPLSPLGIKSWLEAR